MPINPDLPLLRCEFCSLSTRNHFIFNLHRKRCLRENGPQKSETTSVVTNKEEPSQTPTQEGVKKSGKNSGLTGPSSQEQERARTGSKSQEEIMSVKDVPFVVTSAPPSSGSSSTNRITLKLRKRSQSDTESKTEPTPTKILDYSHDSDLEKEMDADFEEKGDPLINSSSSSSGNLVPPQVSRRYKCGMCSFHSMKSREFLRHKRDQHDPSILIFCCVVCEYASQYKHKLARHMSHLHNMDTKLSDIVPDQTPLTSEGTNPPANKKLGSQQRLRKVKKVVSSKAAPKSGQTLDSLLIKLKTKSKVTDTKQASSSSEGAEVEDGMMIAEEDLYKCQLCLFTASSKSKVTRHLQACHINARLFRCNLCTYKTYSKIEFYAHKKKHTSKNTTMFKCAECAYTTEFRPNFDRHRLQHGCDKPCKCSLCSYSTDHEGALKRHVTSHHRNTEENQSAVISGDDGTVTKPSIDGKEDDNDMDTDAAVYGDGYRCPICSSFYRRCADLNRHMKMKHKVGRKEYIEHSAAENDEEVFEIDDDGGDSSEDMLYEEEEEDVADSEDSEESQPLSMLCVNKSGAKMINKKCSYCSYIAKWPSDLRRHMRVHSVVKRFKCSLCWKKYKYLGDLNVHMRRDHEVDPEQEQLTPQKVSTIATKKNSPRLFRCPACPYFTKVKVDMDRHSHSHTEEKTYSCKLCKYETYWRGDMGRHLYRKHPSEVSNDADVKQFFIYRPERRALTKGGRGPSVDIADSDSKDSNSFEESPVAPSVEREEDPEPAEAEDMQEDNLMESVSSSIDNCTVTMDKTGHKTYKCQYCAFSHHQAHKMKAHVDTHLNLKQFKCPECGRRSNWKYDMRKHISSKHPDSKQEPITLSVEEAKATISDYLASLSRVKKDHHPNMLNMSPINIKSIKPSSKPVTPEKPLVPEDKKKRAYEYKCTHCQFRSWYRSSVSKHQRESHQGQEGIGILAKPFYISTKQEMDDDKEPASAPDPDPLQPASAKVKDSSPEKMEVDEEEFMGADVYQCAVCGKEGSSKGAIKKHYNYIHPNDEVRIISVQDGVEFNYYTGLATSLAPPALVKEEKTGSDFKMPPHMDSKKHGNAKPFQCSVCGQRSNWKWDLKKHLRAKHPNEFGHVVVLPMDQAKATCPQKSQATESDPASDEEESTDTDMNGSSSPEKYTMKMSEKPVSPCTTYKYQEMLLGRYRRYKCSGCGYRSNWRTDIIRHIERRHRDENAQVVFMGVEEAKQTFESYDYQPAYPANMSPKKEPCFKVPKPVSPSKSSKKETLVTGRVWHCPKCKFMSAVRTQVVIHMQSHGMKPFRCIACGMMSRFRSPINRHIRNQHKSTQYKDYCKLIIKYTKPGGACAPDQGAQAQFVEAYLCRLCSGNPAETPGKEAMMAHILTEHGSTDASQALKIKKKVGAESGGDSDWSPSDEGGKCRPKRYYCTICPYRTDKRSLLTFHHSYHQPSSQNKYKCKLCPYYVCAPRLLHQHMKFHEENTDDQVTLDAYGWKSATDKTPPSSPSKRGKVEGSPKRHVCEKCPYTTNSKNDFIYHKQFHRPKPAAEYKCEHCDYWVTHRRLLHQHARLHGEEYPDDLSSSPSKSLGSDASAVLDAVEMAAIKQKMITNKITASLSSSPAVSPMKMATQCAAGNRPGYVMRDGVYKKLHHCSKCPYTNIRSRNVRLHELMHGWRHAEHPLMKCPQCDYYVGAKGLLSHHMKVHNQQYRPDPLDSTTFNLEKQERAPGMSRVSSDADDDSQNTVFTSPEIPQRHKVDTLLEISRYKKYSCEKCPYASGKRAHFLRHMELHGSRQRYICQYCDYSVPSMNLLLQHQKIHMMPNQNLLASQSFSNLQHLKEVPADVALASALPPTDSSESITINVIHDHLDLYENDDNNSYDAQPKKLYRCDRCPYANVRRDHLLTHLRFHLSKSDFHCPYCDYSAPKQQLLTQHIRVHFCPLPELSDWLIENGQSERAQEANDIDLTQALEVAEKYQHSAKRTLNSMKAAQSQDDEDNERPTKKSKRDTEETKSEVTSDSSQQKSSSASSAKDGGSSVDPSTRANPETEAGEESPVYVCQYCDREIATSKLLVAHELQHLIGNHFELTDDLSPGSQPSNGGTATKTAEAEKDHQHVTSGGQDEDMDVDQHDDKGPSTNDAQDKSSLNLARSKGQAKQDKDSQDMSLSKSPAKQGTAKLVLKPQTKEVKNGQDSSLSETRDKPVDAGKDMNGDSEGKVLGESGEKCGEGGEKDEGRGADRRYTMRRRADNGSSAANSPASSVTTVSAVENKK